MARTPKLDILRANCPPCATGLQQPMLTKTPAWTVYAWPPVLWQAACAPRLQLVHLGTRVIKKGVDGSGSNCGQTLWAASSGECAAGVAWDWIELRCGVVAIADPLALVTNLTLVDAQGEVLSPHAAAAHLNELVHGLPWQSEVCRALLEPNG